MKNLSLGSGIRETYSGSGRGGDGVRSLYKYKSVWCYDLFVAWYYDGVCPMLADQLVLDADGDVHEGEGVQLGQHHVEPLHHLLAMFIKISVPDP